VRSRLALAVWALAGCYERPERNHEVRPLARAAARAALALSVCSGDVALSGVVVQIRGIAVDLVRAADLIPDDPNAANRTPTEELLLEPAPAGSPTD
jgi:hypothetical protein